MKLLFWMIISQGVDLNMLYSPTEVLEGHKIFLKHSFTCLFAISFFFSSSPQVFICFICVLPRKEETLFEAISETHEWVTLFLIWPIVKVEKVVQGLRSRIPIISVTLSALACIIHIHMDGEPRYLYTGDAIDPNARNFLIGI